MVAGHGILEIMNETERETRSNTQNKLSFIMPVAIGSNRVLPKWRKNTKSTTATLQLILAVTSIIRFFNKDHLDTFILITREEDIDVVRGLITRIEADTSVRIYVISELELCPLLSLSNHTTLSGWQVQQLIKLAAAKMVNTSFYVALDADVICTRKCDATSFVQNGKALTNVQRYFDYYRLYNNPSKENRIKIKRTKNASALLKMKRPMRYWGRYYGDTPVVLHTESVKSLTRYIGDTYSSEWQDVLAENNNWTEYALYFLYMEKTGKIQRYHSMSGRQTILNLDNSIWLMPQRLKKPLDYENWPQEDLNNHHGPFVVVQTWFDEKSWLPTKYKGINEFYYSVAQRLGMGDVVSKVNHEAEITGE